MSRPPTRPRSEVLERAKEAFWENGYEATSLADLEIATGLSRSSLYHAFGSKERLFGEALDLYIGAFVNDLFAPVEARGAAPAAILAYLEALSAHFNGEARMAQRGCLWVNTIAEFAGNGREVSLATAYRARLSKGFFNSLSGGALLQGPERLTAQRRSEVLTASVIGLWLLVRIDSVEAARTCDSLCQEVGSWLEGDAANVG